MTADNDNKKNDEKTATTIRIFGSTDRLIKRWKGNLSTAQFMSEAVQYYVRHFLDNGDDLSKIRVAIEQINDRQNINLGLLCEVLRQEGILNGNGEITPLKKG